MRRTYSVLLTAVISVSCFFLVASNLKAQTYMFNRASFGTGSNPGGMALADFNGDGRLDAALINDDSTLSLFLGNPDGTLATKVDIPTASSPRQLIAADFNGDGKMDLAMTLYPNGVSVMLGNGDGTFQPHEEFPTGAYPYGLTVADFNHDGNLDLALVDVGCATGNCPTGAVSILLGNGDGTFQANTDYNTALQPGYAIAADFNGDGNIDLVVTCFYFNGNYNTSVNKLSILIGNGDGTFQPHVDYTVDYAPEALAAADFNGDGKLDLMIATGFNMDLLLGNGDGTFQGITKIQPNSAPLPSLVLAADFNHDGKMDFVTSAGGGAAVYLGNGDGTFQTGVPYLTGAQQGPLGIGDFNGDGAIDIASVNSYAKTLTILLGNGNGAFSPVSQLPTLPVYQSFLFGVGSRAGAMADFTGDGKPDLALAVGNDSYSAGNVVVFPGNGGGTLGTPVVNNFYATALAPADFNGDTQQDLAYANENGAAVALSNGDGTFGTPNQIFTSAATPAAALATGDFNHDGKADVVVLANGFTTNPPIYVFLGNGNGTFQGLAPFGLGTSIPTGIATADFNRDGNLDLAIPLNAAGVALLLGKGDGTFQAPVMYEATNELPSVIAADFNGDGNPDMAICGNAFNGVNIYLGKGDGTFQTPVAYPTTTSVGGPVVGDFNDDGKLGIVLSMGNPGSLVFMLGNGDGTFQPPLPVDGQPVFAAGDFNQDGYTDLLLAGGYGSLFLSKPLASVYPGYLNFGGESQGSTSVSKIVTLTNVGTSPLAVSNVSTTGDFAATSHCGTSLAKNTSCTIDVTYAPSSLGSAQGTLTVIDNTILGAHSMALFGVGTSSSGAPTVSLSTNQLTFSTQGAGTNSSPQTVTLTNSGDGVLIITSITAGGDFHESNHCGSSLNAGANCSILVTFSPRTSGARTGTLTVVDNAAGSPQTVNLSGTGASPTVNLSADSIDFGNQTVGTTSAAKSVTVTNTGNVPLTFTGIEAGGAFNLAASGTTCSTSSQLAVNASCVASVTFSPAMKGTSIGMLILTDNNNAVAGSTQTVNLTGTGTAPVVSLSTSALTFAGQLAGISSSAQTVTLSNTGNDTLNITSIAASGDFAQTNNCGTSLSAGGNCTISVTFNPTALGTRTGTVTITDNAAGSPETVSLSGTGIAPHASLSASSLTFGDQAAGSTSPAKGVTISNSGTGPLTFTQIAVTGDFALATSGTTCGTNSPVAASGSCVVNVTFSPKGEGSLTGALTLTDNDATVAGSSQTVSLSGTGLAPVVSLSATTLTFTGQISGSTSAAQTVTLSNTGNDTLSISGITASGDFAQTNNCGNSLSAAGSCTISVTFKPTATGTRAGTLSIADNAMNSPQTVGLSGTGEDFSFVPSNGSTTTATVTAGQQATYKLSVGGEGGLAGTVTFTCTGAPSEATCTVSPNPLTVGATATTVNVTVSTTAPTIVAPRPAPPAPPLSPGFELILMLALSLAAMAWAFALGKRNSLRMWRFGLVPLAAGLVLALALAGCGGGGGGGGGGPVGNPGTPSGTYSLTVTGMTGSGATALSHAVALTLKVGP